MIKHDGVDIPRIEYIDPVDGKVSILRVMQDGVQIWPSEAEPLQIPTGITLREVFVTKPNIPTGIQLGEYEIIPNIEWDYDKMYIGEGDNVNLVTLYFTGQDADVTSIPAITDWVLDPFNVVNTVTVYTDRVELLMNTPFTSASSVTISYSPGVNPLKDIDGYLLPELNDQPLENLLVPSYTYLLDDYPGAAGAYSLRKLRTGETQAVRVRRDSDNAATDVYLYDDPSKSIDLLSDIEVGGTLGDWAGSDNVYVRKWYDQSSNNNHLLQTTNTIQPRIINAGVLNVLNGNATINNNLLTSLLEAPRLLATGLWSIHAVASLETVSSSSSNLINQHPGTSIDGRTIWIRQSSTDQKRISYYNWGTGNINAVYSTDWQIGQFSISTYGNNDTYDFAKNGDTPEILLTGQPLVPLDTSFNIGNYGNAASSARWQGSYQEIIVYADDQSANRTVIEANINSAYNIYVVTAEVDAQLIQADNDNVSDTIIEINGVRSSASDTAVANLISRNVTVITT